MTAPSSSTACQTLRDTYLQCMASFAQLTTSKAEPSQQMSCRQAYRFAAKAQQAEPLSYLKDIRIVRDVNDSTPGAQTYAILTLPQFKCLLKCARKPASEQEDAACKTDCLFNARHSAFAAKKKLA